MGKLKTVGYELRDVAVMQAPVSFCNHRGDVNPFINVCDREVYPIFVAPMASVTDQNNYKKWIENKLTPVVPRSVQKSENNPNGLTFEERMELAKETFVSVSLKEAQNELYDYLDVSEYGELAYTWYICIDIAHGTLSELYDICKKLKFEYGKHIVLMAGNVANPAAYSFYADAGVDYCRVGIGGGSRCTTSCATGIHMGLATLLDQMNEARKAYAHSHNGNAPTKIIADGGIDWYDCIPKSLSLGADAVMIGKLFAECEEACGEIFYAKDIISAEHEYSCYKSIEPKDCMKKYRNYAGMSHRSSQKITGGDGSKVSEGIVKPVEVKYPVSHWIENMNAYLRSSMTYTNSMTIKEMQENAQVIILGGSGDAGYRK